MISHRDKLKFDNTYKVIDLTIPPTGSSMRSGKQVFIWQIMKNVPMVYASAGLRAIASTAASIAKTQKIPECWK